MGVAYLAVASRIEEEDDNLVVNSVSGLNFLYLFEEGNSKPEQAAHEDRETK